VVVGIAACGVTPFVRGAVRRARSRGARTVFVTCAPEAKGLLDADVVINPRVGAEVITGSTRMKAGTATKLVLNTLTTAAMVRIGKVFGNLMVDLKATNEKLRDRAERIVMEMTGLTRGPARRLLRRAGGETKTAVVMHKRRASAAEARRLLDAAGGMLRRALEGRPR
jgi:N-acetylmuramic acid 6-phosphate etherase